MMENQKEKTLFIFPWRLLVYYFQKHLKKTIWWLMGFFLYKYHAFHQLIECFDFRENVQKSSTVQHV